MRVQPGSVLLVFWEGTTEPADIGTLGEGVLAGILDTGINFDHPSFSDTPQDLYVYNWTGDYKGVCAPVDEDPAYASACNDKLVGAYSYTGEALSPEDADGHGSHRQRKSQETLSHLILWVLKQQYLVLPAAQIIAYDVCDEGGCYTDSSTAAVQQAAGWGKCD